MFHMLSCFDLKKGVSINEFSESNTVFATHMKELDLLESIGPIGQRQKHPVMDTDDERSQEYFFLMSFKDREQCDRAVDCIQSSAEPEISIHHDVSCKIDNYVFVCWADI